MKKTSKPSIDYLFESGRGGLQYILQKVQFLQGLQEVLEKLLDKPLAEHCWAANIRDNCLIIGTSSPAWAMQLRYAFPKLLRELRSQPGLEMIGQLEYYVSAEGKGNPHKGEELNN